MENATKAIIMAGGLLISMIVITVFYFMFGNASSTVGEMQDDTAQKELIAFNKGFEAYNKKMMYGADVVSVFNKAIDNNRSYNVMNGYNSADQKFIDYYVDVEITVFRRDANNMKISESQKETLSLSNNYNGVNNQIYTRYISKVQNPAMADEITYFKFAGFRCTGVFYTSAADLTTKTNQTAIGRVKRICFEEIWEEDLV